MEYIIIEAQDFEMGDRVTDKLAEGWNYTVISLQQA